MAEGTLQLPLLIRSFGTSAEAVVPDFLGGVKTWDGVADVTVEIDNWLTTVPNGARIILHENGLYLMEGARPGNQGDVAGFIIPPDRVGLKIEFNGAAIISRKMANYRFTFVDGVIEAPDVNGVYHIRSASNPFGPLANTIYSWYVRGPGITGAVRAGKAQFNAPGCGVGRIALTGITTPPPIPGTGVTITITSPADRDRSHIAVQGAQHILLDHPKVRGPNVTHSAFDFTIEGQHGIHILGGRDVEVRNPDVTDVNGDCINTSRGVQPGQTFVPSFHITGRRTDPGLRYAARHLLGITSAQDSSIEYLKAFHARRHIIDIEPNSGQSKIDGLSIRHLDCGDGDLGFLAISAYAGSPVFVGNVDVAFNDIADKLTIPIGGNHTGVVRWGPIRIRRNICTTPEGTGKGFQTDAYYLSHWPDIPAVIKAQYVDVLEVIDNTLLTQFGRGMWGVFTRFCTGVDVHSNSGFEAGREVHIIPFGGAQGRLGIPIQIRASGASSASSNAHAHLGVPIGVRAVGRTGARASGELGVPILVRASGETTGGSSALATLSIPIRIRAKAYDPAVVSSDGLDRGGAVILRGPGWDATPWDSGGWDEGRP